MSDDILHQTIALARRLSPQEKVRLLEAVTAALGEDLAEQPPTQGQTWGAAMLAELDALDTSEWREMDIPDEMEWVKVLRKAIWEKHKAEWDEQP